MLKFSLWQVKFVDTIHPESIQRAAKTTGKSVKSVLKSNRKFSKFVPVSPCLTDANVNTMMDGATRSKHLA